METWRGTHGNGELIGEVTYVGEKLFFFKKKLGILNTLIAPGRYNYPASNPRTLLTRTARKRNSKTVSNHKIALKESPGNKLYESTCCQGSLRLLLGLFS